MAADADRALGTCLLRHLPDRSHSFYPIGASVQIALRGEWIGTFRVITHSSSNLILGREVAKWQKVKTRLVMPETDGHLETAGIPDEDEETIREEDTAHLGRQIPALRRRRSSRDDPMGIDDSMEEIFDFWSHWAAVINR